VKAFDGYDAIVTPSGSCAGSARHQHGIVARRSGDAALVAAVERTAPRTYELSEFLVDVLGVTDVGAYFPHRVTYHPTCHSLRMLGVGDRPERLLREVRGLDLVELPRAEECCGFGGTFAVKNADTSVAMVSDKARHVRETVAEVLVAGDNSCLMNIGGALTRQRAGVRVMHLAEILASTEAS
jgi:Fe-S oxidoreductase